MNFEQAIEVLRNLVKFSAIEGQKHLDLSIATAEDRPTCEQALMICRQEVAQGKLSEEDLRARLGLL
jgi:hypothetical protein